jgi:hypothetical protein
MTSWPYGTNSKESVITADILWNTDLHVTNQAKNLTKPNDKFPVID